MKYQNTKNKIKTIWIGNKENENSLETLKIKQQRLKEDVDLKFYSFNKIRHFIETDWTNVLIEEDENYIKGIGINYKIIFNKIPITLLSGIKFNFIYKPKSIIKKLTEFWEWGNEWLELWTDKSTDKIWKIEDIYDDENVVRATLDISEYMFLFKPPEEIKSIQCKLLVSMENPNFFN